MGHYKCFEPPLVRPGQASHRSSRASRRRWARVIDDQVGRKPAIRKSVWHVRELDNDHARGERGLSFADYWGRPQGSAMAGAGRDVRLHYDRNSNSCFFCRCTLGFAPRRGIMIVDMFSKHLWTRNSWRRSDGAGRNAGTFVPPANQEIACEQDVNGWGFLSISIRARGRSRRDDSSSCQIPLELILSRPSPRVR